jgi:uncharacterized protein (TIGR00369 family)
MEPDFEERVRTSFARQTMMTTIGATMTRLGRGTVEIELPCAPHILQQHGFVHGGAVGMIADSACGFAALTVMPPNRAVLTTEYKINFMAPADGELLVAKGRVVRAGRTLTVALAEVEAVTGENRKLVALMTATMMAVEGRGLEN